MAASTVVNGLTSPNVSNADAGALAEEQCRAAKERAAIDSASRLPALAWLAGATFWLLWASFFGLVTSIKMHIPWFDVRVIMELGIISTLLSVPLMVLIARSKNLSLDAKIGFCTFAFVAAAALWLVLRTWVFDIRWSEHGGAWQTFGRTRMTHLSLIGYGWGTQAGIAGILWLVPRLSRTPLIYPNALIAAAAIWNVGIFAGVIGILAGLGTSVEWLDFPPFVPPFLIVSLAIVAAWGIVTFTRRQESHVYVTLWYCFGAMFWMPWLYTVAVIINIYSPATGVVQSACNWWFAHNVLGLWLTPIGVGAAYYIIPKVIGRPVYSYYLSIIGFWSLALFYSWAGMHHLIGGPIPPWMVSASTVGSMMMFIPVIAVGVNHHMTMLGHMGQLRYSPSLRFVVFGAITYTAVSAQGAIEALREFSEVAHFTNYTVGHAHLGAYGFFTMIMFGVFYYMVPRLTGQEWASSRLIRLHFWLCSVGIVIYFTSLSISGWFEGRQMNNPDYPFIQKMSNELPWLICRSIGGAMMSLGHVAWAILFVLNICGVGSRREGPTFFREKTSAEVEAELNGSTATPAEVALASR